MNQQLSILNIIEDTTVDGPGFRTSIYAAGCTHHCHGCHNPESWNVEHGLQTPVEDILQVILSDPFADVTFSGGDPLYQPEGFITLAKAIKEQSTKTIWCYTGYLFEEIVGDSRRSPLLSFIDVLVDGRFVESLKDERLFFRGSSNQRLIDVPASLKEGHVVLYDCGENSLS